MLLRLFILTLLAWIGSRFGLGPNGKPRPVVFWAANLISAVLFGVGHLPATAAAGLPLDVVVISRAIALNALLGVACGYLYWRNGLESAILAHFSADLVLHVLPALL